MNLIENFLELFRKKEYYSVGYATLNTFKLSFKEVTDTDLNKIKNIVIHLNEAKKIDDKKSKLWKKDAVCFLDINDLILSLKDVIHEDYKHTYFEAINGNWDFIYFLSDFAKIYKDVLFLNNRMYSGKLGEGEVIYPVLAIKKQNNSYYLWNLLEKYEGYI